jgi:hypothetical protein
MVQRQSRNARWLAASSVPLIILALVTASPLMSIGACLSWPVACIAAVMSLRALVNAGKYRADLSEQVSRRKPVLLLAVCVGLLLGCTALNMQCLAVVRIWSKQTITSHNLRFIWGCCEDYIQRHGVTPPSLDSLIAEGLTPPSMCVSLFDRKARRVAPSGDKKPCSYVYVPGPGKHVSDPDLIIAYEREAFDIVEPRVFAPKERWVLFSDGQVRHLSDAEFEQALVKDARRRRELGWPVPTGAPPQRPVSQPSPAVTLPAG